MNIHRRASRSELVIQAWSQRRGNAARWQDRPQSLQSAISVRYSDINKVVSIGAVPELDYPGKRTMMAPE